MGTSDIAEHFIRAAESALNKGAVPEHIEKRFRNNNVPGLARLQVAILIINRTGYTLRRAEASVAFGEWNTSNPYILTAPSTIKPMEERWMVAENNALVAQVKGKVRYTVDGVEGGAFEVEFKNATTEKNEWRYSTTIGGDTIVEAYGGSGSRAYVAFDIKSTKVMRVSSSAGWA